MHIHLELDVEIDVPDVRVTNSQFLRMMNKEGGHRLECHNVENQ